MITTEQRVMVGKDRLLDELTDLNESAEGYWNIEDRAQIRRLGAILAMPDDSEETLEALIEAGYINGEEHIFWGRGNF